MKRTLSILLAFTLLVFTVFPAFARGYGGGFSSSRGFSSGRSFSGGFSSTKSMSSSYSRGFSSRPNVSFTKSTPKTMSFTKPVSSPRIAVARSTRPIQVTRVVHTTTVVNHYGSSNHDLLTTMLLYNALSSSNHNENISIRRSDLNSIRYQMLKCHDQGGGRSCITRYL